jgi:hypothetical protein
MKMMLRRKILLPGANLCMGTAPDPALPPAKPKYLLRNGKQVKMETEGPAGIKRFSCCGCIITTGRQI